jgi:hypothetical protein
MVLFLQGSITIPQGDSSLQYFLPEDRKGGQPWIIILFRDQKIYTLEAVSKDEAELIEISQNTLDAYKKLYRCFEVKYD